MADTPAHGEWQQPSLKPWVLLNPKATVGGDRVRLFCIPQAGMGAWAFHNWSGKISNEINIMPIELPGRNTRLGEKKATSMQSLVLELTEALIPIIREGKPYAIFGHSMGAWIAYELIKELHRREVELPVRLYVSANRAPQLAGIQHDVHPVEMHKLGFTEFWEAFERRYGKSEDLTNMSIKKFIWPLFQADFQIIEQYRPSPGLQLPVAIIAFGVLEDTRYTEDQMECWKACSPDPFQLHWFPGTHSYIMTRPEPMLEVLESDLLSLIRK